MPDYITGCVDFATKNNQYTWVRACIKVMGKKSHLVQVSEELLRDKGGQIISSHREPEERRNYPSDFGKQI